MELVSGEFRWPGGGSLYIPPANLHGGWGRAVSLHVVGEEQKPLPDSMDVLFFSYLENKFYRGRFALPRDSIARLFREGFQRVNKPGGRATYEMLVAGVAPGGDVAVWAAGSERQVEVFFGRAEPANDIDFHRAFDAPDDIDQKVFVAREVERAAKSDPLVRLAMQHVPVGRWAAYRARFRWQPVFTGLKAPDRVSPVSYVNGERDNLLAPLAGDAAARGRPVPSYLAFDEPQTGRSYEVTFDAQETVDAFAKAGEGGGAVDLVFDTGASPAGNLRVVVRSGATVVPLRGAKVEVFGTD